MAKLTMIFQLVALFILCASSGISGQCEYGRSPGLFDNAFTDPAPTNFIPDDETDTDTAIGNDPYSVTLTNAANLFSKSTNKLVIYDSGIILTEVPATFPAAHTDLNLPYIAPYWVISEANTDFVVTYKHLEKAAMTAADGTDVGPSKCDLQRVENIVNSCREDKSRNFGIIGEIEVVEAVIATWKFDFDDGATQVTNLFQAVVAIGKDTENGDQMETFVIFLFDSTPSGPAAGYTTVLLKANGLYSDAANAEYARPCIVKSEIEKKTNCPCNSWMTGIYVVATRDNSAEVAALPEAEYGAVRTYLMNTCSMDDTAYDAKCASTDQDTGRNYQLNCRPARIPKDSCTEDIRCRIQPGSNKMTIAIKVDNPGDWDTFVFVDVTTINNPTPTLQTGAECKKALTIDNGAYTFEMSFSETAPPCGMVVAGEDVEFAVFFYNEDDFDTVNVAYGRAFYLHGKCTPSDLPVSVDGAIDFNSIFDESVQEVTDVLEAFFATQRTFEPADVAEIRLVDGAEVYFGEDVYLAVALTTTGTPPVSPYGIYVTNCYVSNNPEFLIDSTSTLRSRQIFADGCRTTADGDAFDTRDDGFQSVYKVVGDTPGHVVMSGRMDAARWTATDALYFKCEVGFCRNEEIFTDSKCFNSCDNEFVDTMPARKKRSANDTETATVQAYIKIVDRPVADKQDGLECVSSTVAITTLVALIVLLVLAVSATLFMFIKFQRRVKK